MSSSRFFRSPCGLCAVNTGAQKTATQISFGLVSRPVCPGSDANLCDALEPYDAIIIGAGTAGAVLASVLSDPSTNNQRVLLLERGTNQTDDPLVRFPCNPVVYFNNIWEPRFSELVTSTFDARQQEGDTYAISRMWGGGSSLNYLLAVRRTPDSANRLAADVGSSLWNYENMLPVYKDLEAYQGPNPTGTRGTNGAFTITPAPFETGTLAQLLIGDNQNRGSLLNGYSAVQVPVSPDYNAAANAACARAQQTFTKSDGQGPCGVTRVQSADVFLNASVVNQETGQGVMGRQLQVQSLATATRLLFAGFYDSVSQSAEQAQQLTARANTAAGPLTVDAVEYVEEGVTRLARVKPNGRVILSAGWLYSPLVLQRSGYGPSDLLSSLGIPVLHANDAVGANLRNHVGSTVMCAVDASLIFGPNGISTLLAFLPRTKNDDNDRSRATMTLVIPGPQLDPSTNQTLSAQLLPGQFFVSFLNWVLLTDVRGRVSLTDPDPMAPPRIDYTVYDTANDLDLVLNVTEHVMDSFTAILPQLPPGCRILYPPPEARNNRDLLAQYVFVGTSTAFHQTGTCSMSADPASRVVEADSLRVVGTTNAYVCDSCIYPEPEDGNTAYDAIAAAYKFIELHNLGPVNIPPSVSPPETLSAGVSSALSFGPPTTPSPSALPAQSAAKTPVEGLAKSETHKKRKATAAAQQSPVAAHAENDGRERGFVSSRLASAASSRAKNQPAQRTFARAVNAQKKQATEHPVAKSQSSTCPCRRRV